MRQVASGKSHVAGKKTVDGKQYTVNREVTSFRPLVIFSVLTLFFGGVSHSFFWGRISDEKAGRIMAGMKDAYQAKDCESVLSGFEEFLREKPSAGLKREGYKYAGLCYEEKNYVEKALGLYKLAVLLYPEDMFFHKRLGGVYLSNGFYENSAELFAKVVKKNGQDFEAMLSLARSYRKLGFLSRAKEYYVKCVLNEDFRVPSTAAEYAEFLLEKNDVPDALFTVGRALDSSRTASLLLLKARVLAYAGRYSEAVDSIDEAGKLGPLGREARIRKVLYSVFAGDYSLEKELEYFRGDYFYSFIRGILRYKKGDLTGSAADFSVSAEKGGEFVRKVSLDFLERLNGEKP